MRLAPRPHSSDVFYPNGDQGIGLVFIGILVLELACRMWTHGKTGRQAARIRLFMFVIISVLICLMIYRSL